MKRIFLYNTLIIITLLVGCRKVDLEPIDGSPVFTATADLDGDQHRWEAGLEGYYMFSMFEKDALDVYEFSGSFAKNDGTVGEILTIRIRDFQQVPLGSPSVEQAFDMDLSFASNSGIDTIWKTVVDTAGWNTIFDASGSILPNSPVTYTWEFGDSTTLITSTQTVPHFYDILPNQSVKLTIASPNNACVSTMTKTLKINGQNSDCNISIELLPYFNPINFDSGYILNVLPVGAYPFDYSWNNTSVDSFYIISDSLSNISAAVTVTDANGCAVSSSISTSPQGTSFPQICMARFNNSPVILDTVSVTFIDNIIYGDSLQLSKAKIEYTTGNGNFYSSFLGPQPSTSFIKILDVKDYDNNENGDKTKKVTLEYTCRIWTMGGEYIDIKNGKATIAIAHP